MGRRLSNFHKTKKSAAVLKHAIIDQYATPFASKTGTTSLDHRVAFIDGYAGPGRYEDGEEWPGAMLLRKAEELAHFPARSNACPGPSHRAKVEPAGIRGRGLNAHAGSWVCNPRAYLVMGSVGAVEGGVDDPRDRTWSGGCRGVACSCW